MKSELKQLNAGVHKKFGKDLANFLMPILNDKNIEPLMIAGMMMKMTIELYTKLLDDDAIHTLLSVVDSTVEDIRKDAIPINRTIH